MASGKSKNIDEIDDFQEMYETMKALNISSKGCKTLDQMKDRVKTEFDQSAKRPTWTAGQAFSIFSEAKDEDERKRQILLKYYDDAKKFLDQMDEKILNLLQQEFGNIKEKIIGHKSQLTHKEYYLLVAGETGAGKSSLVNLILGEELLPYSLLSTTSTICELKFGDERKIVTHFKDKDPETGSPTKEILLSTEECYIQQISRYVHVKSDREKGSSYKKIELFWPHSLLQKGIVIIDSPGIGESDIMDEIVTQYLPEAFAFIYVINITNAGGVQKDRLEKLLEGTRKKQGILPSTSALFVCNKWDQVPEGEVKDVKDHVIQNLQRCWPGLDPDSQIMCMSTMKANVAQKFGFISKEFSSLMSGISVMVFKSIYARLETSWRWLFDLFSRTIFHAKAFVKFATTHRKVAEDKLGLILSSLEVLEGQEKKVMAELNEYLEERINSAKQRLSKYLSSEEVKARFTSWTLDEVPNVQRSWEETESHILTALVTKMRQIIARWEEDNQVFKIVQESLVKYFQEHYLYFEVQLQNLQSDTIADNVHVEENDDVTFPLGAKVIIGVTFPIWVPLSLVGLVIGAPVVGVIAIKEILEENRKIKYYEANKCAFMAEQSERFLHYIHNGTFVREFVTDLLEGTMMYLKQIEERIPEWIQNHKMLCDHLLEDSRSQQEIQNLYQPIMENGSYIREQLALFGLKEIPANDIKSNELDWKEDTHSLLGCGAFGVVYSGTMTGKGDDKPVALKVPKNALGVKNAIELTAEVALLRKLEHPYIVKFYGTSLLKNSYEARLVLVMEKCKGSLKSHIFDSPERIPGKCGNPDVTKVASRWVIQITDALMYIHQQHIVHRDLKLENILLSEDNSVRITDVGVSKPAADITGTIVGTPVYIAPEVFHSKVYDCSADIYSLGIILWEIWYGQQAFAEVANLGVEFFVEQVDRGYRPKNVRGCQPPPLIWEELMNLCWAGNREERPTAGNCNTKITTFFSQLSG